MRLADDVGAGARPPLDLSGFAGTWTSSDRRTLGVRRLVLAVRDGELAGRVNGAGPDGEIDWGPAVAGTLYAESIASPKAAGFVLHYDFGPQKCHVQVNLKLGVAVAGIHHVFAEASGRRNGFYREFMARDDSPAEPAEPIAGSACAKEAELGTYAVDGPIDPGVLLGHWKNTNRQTRGIAEVTVEPRGDDVSLRLFGASTEAPLDWGEARGELFGCVEEDDVASAAALAAYDFGFMECDLQVRQNKGILAVTSFNRFGDASGRRDYVTRDLFYRTLEGT